MAVSKIGTNALSSGLDVSSTNISYTGTLTGGTGVVNIGSGQVYKDASGNVGIGTSSPQRKLDVTVNDTTTAQVYLRNNNASYASGMIVYNAGGEASMFRHNGGSDTSYAGANSVNIGSVTNNVVGLIQNNSERARIDGGGILVGTTSSTNLPGGGTSAANGIYISTSGQIRLAKDAYTLQMGANTSGANIILQQFFQQGTNCGQIVVSNSNATAYQTSSDYRLKDNPQPMVNALATVAALKPCTWTWKNSGTPGQGFIAHEVQQYFPDAVSGEKDGVDEEGKPKYQGIDTSFLVATLTAAIQELKAELDSVKAELAVLKGV